MVEDLSCAPPKSVIVLHVCAHNPTGLDLTHAQWEIVADICQDRQLLPFFDCAYQGFASGCPDTDAWPVRWGLSTGVLVVIWGVEHLADICGFEH